MHAESFSGLPAWAQILLTAFGGIGVLIGMVVKYAKGIEHEKPSGDHLVLSSTIADGDAIRRLIDATDRNTSTMNLVLDELRRNTEETHQLTRCAGRIHDLIERFADHRDRARDALSRNHPNQ